MVLLDDNIGNIKVFSPVELWLCKMVAWGCAYALTISQRAVHYALR
jgi:hypothetical protein